MEHKFLQTTVAEKVSEQLPPAPDAITTVVLENELLRVVHANLPTGKDLSHHYFSGPAVVTVVSGNVEFALGKEKYSLRSGDVVYLRPLEAHSFTAKEGIATLSYTLIKAEVDAPSETSGGCCGGNGSGRAGGCGCGGGA